MASGISYRRFEQGTALVVPLGTAAAPSVLFGDDNAQGGLNDGLFGTSVPTVGVSINGTSVWSVNSSGTITAGSILSSNATGGIGYTTGAGGAITQGTDKSTTVVLNTATGRITLNNAALASLATVSFTVTDSAVAIGDVVMVNHGSAGTAGLYYVQANTITAGSFKISVQNFSGTSASEAIVLHFAVIKSVAA